jgi:hypothetical protein
VPDLEGVPEVDGVTDGVPDLEGVIVTDGVCEGVAVVDAVSVEVSVLMVLADR